MAINLFPVRVPIGRVIDSAGVERDVLMTVEFSRALADVLQRIGGPSGQGTDDLALLQAFEPLPAVDTAMQANEAAIRNAPQDLGAQVAALRAQIDALQVELNSIQSYAALAQQVDELRATVGMIEDPAAAVRSLAGTKQANIVKGTATGSRAANAALASLLTALATSGLVIDSTTV